MADTVRGSPRSVAARAGWLWAAARVVLVVISVLTLPLGPARGDDGAAGAPPAGAIDVRRFGARGDGRSDDTGAIQGAINAAIRVRGTVYIPAGTYLLASTAGSVDRLPDRSPQWSALLLMGDRVTITGDGKATVLKLAARMKMRMLTITGRFDTIENLVFDGNKQERNGGVGWPQGDVVSAMINARPPSEHLTFRNVEIRNGLEDGIGLWNSPYATIDRCYSHDNGTPQAGSTGFSIGGPRNVGSRLINSVAAANSTANVWLSFGPRDVLLQNNVIERGARAGIGIGGNGPANTRLSSGIRIRRNVIRNNAGLGINVVSSQNGEIVGNTISDNGGGVSIDDQGTIPSANWDIENNRLTNNGSSREHRHGLLIGGQSSQIDLKGNVILNNGSDAAHQVIITSPAAVSPGWESANTIGYRKETAQPPQPAVPR